MRFLLLGFKTQRNFSIRYILFIYSQYNKFVLYINESIFLNYISNIYIYTSVILNTG